MKTTMLHIATLLMNGERSFVTPQAFTLATATTDFTHGSNLDFSQGRTGDSGNGKTIHLLDPGTESATLTKSWASPCALHVNLATDAGGTGTLTHGAGNAAVTFTAPAAGSTPYKVAIVEGAAGGNLGAAYSGTTKVLTVTLGMTAGTAATVDLTDASGLGSIEFTNPDVGEAGNDISIAIQTQTGNNVAMNATYDSTTKAIVILLGTDADGDPDATKNTDDLIAAKVNTKFGASIATSGSTGSFDSPRAAVSLASGADPIPDDAKNTATLLEGLSPVSGWTIEKGGSGAGVVTALAETTCTGGGENPAISTTLAQLITLLTGDTGIGVALADGATDSELCEACVLTLADGVDGIVLKPGEAVMDEDFIYLAVGQTTVRDSSKLKKIALLDFVES